MKFKTLFVQLLLGILTILNSASGIPVGLGVAHQAVAVILLTAVVIAHFSLQPDRSAVET